MQGYEQAFKQALRAVIDRTQDPNLRATFEKMLSCPIQDRRGNCRSFSSYIVDALIKNGIHQQYDMEAALGYVFEKMMMPSTDTGEPRSTVFSGFDENRPFKIGDNPLQARFMKFLEFAVRNIRKGKIVRLRKAEARPAGTVSIGVGRAKEGDPSQGMSPDQLPARPSTDTAFGEIVADLLSNLRQKEAAYGLPLVAVFQAMLTGQRSDALRQTYGDRAARTARQVVIQTIEEFARSTENYALLRLLQRLQAGESAGTTRQPPKSAPPRLPVGKEKDFASIVAVIDRLGKPFVGSSDLGKYRRRWLEYPPRDSASGYRNRLEETLAKMAEEGVLKATRTSQGGVRLFARAKLRPVSSARLGSGVGFSDETLFLAKKNPAIARQTRLWRAMGCGQDRSTVLRQAVVLPRPVVGQQRVRRRRTGIHREMEGRMQTLEQRVGSPRVCGPLGMWQRTSGLPRSYGQPSAKNPAETDLLQLVPRRRRGKYRARLPRAIR